MREKGGNKKYQYLQQIKFILLAEYRDCSIGSSGTVIGFYASFCIPKNIRQINCCQGAYKYYTVTCSAEMKLCKTYGYMHLPGIDSRSSNDCRYKATIISTK
jgi:hypothetical protein